MHFSPHFLHFTFKKYLYVLYFHLNLKLYSKDMMSNILMLVAWNSWKEKLFIHTEISNGQ